MIKQCCQCLVGAKKMKEENFLRNNTTRSPSNRYDVLLAGVIWMSQEAGGKVQVSSLQLQEEMISQ